MAIFGFIGGGSTGGGGGSDKNYVHTQLAPSTTWTVNHNLGKRCAVQVVDNLATEIIGSVTWVDNNTVTVEFNVALTGFVYCN